MFQKLLKTIAEKFKSRVFILCVVIVALFSLMAQRLFALQIVHGQEYQDNFVLQIEKHKEIKSTRGNIYDCKGRLLAYNELAYSITIEDDGSFDDLSQSEKNNALNQTILNTIRIIESNGDRVVSSFDIIVDEMDNYMFTSEEGTSRKRFLADVYGLAKTEDLEPSQRNASAQDVIDYLAGETRYDFDQTAYDKSTVLKVITIRYLMTQKNFTQYLDTVIATDVSEETVADISENKDVLKGVDVLEDSIRRYKDAEYFASVVGYTGIISPEEYEEYSQTSDRYSLTDIVGKAGVEKIMDETLQGVKGHDVLYVDRMGKIISHVDHVDPIAGNNVYLTIDSRLQEAVYQIIEQELAGVILRKLQDVMEYDPHDAEDTYKIVIPIGKVYTSFFENSLLDVTKIAESDPVTVQHAVYERFRDQQEMAIRLVQDEILNPSGPRIGYNKKMTEFVNFLTRTYLVSQGILMKEEIDTNDLFYRTWMDEESVSLRDFLNYGISRGWIDAAHFIEPDDSIKYMDSTEIIQELVNFLGEHLKTSVGFTQLVYKYMVLEGQLSGTEVCLMACEQGIFNEEPEVLNELVNGTMDSFTYLHEKIRTLQLTPAMMALEPCTGSCVLTNPQSGEVLACVSYPGYNNNRLANTMDSDYYNQLVNDKSRPLYNNATQERTAPGSTFKMVTSLAGLESGVVTPEDFFSCAGEFGRITDGPKCWVYPGSHGLVDCENAIAVSCNCYFYNVGYELGLNEKNQFSNSLGVEKLAEYASEFGFDGKSGIELPEKEPQISDIDAVRTAIGQGTHNYTTAQMATYVTAVANRGTVYNISLIDKVVDNKNNILEDHVPEIRKTIKASDSTWDTIQAGMVSMVQSSKQFATVKGSLKMGGKTGTAQESLLHPDHVLFVGYAPAEKPVLGMAIRIANGYTSVYTAEIGEDIVDYYFALLPKEKILSGTAKAVQTIVTHD